MKHILLVATILVSIAFFATAAEPFVLEELHLIHWEELPEGKPSNTGPVSAAILMAWYAEHGYPNLLPDLNHDGQMNEHDTLLLAREFSTLMGGDLIDDRLADPFIVYPLARYVAERYPDEFRMLIYDMSFPEEVDRDLGQPFVPTEISGIFLEVLEDPFYELYVHHLEQRRPGIVGIGHDVPEWNDFAVSRSYVPAEEPQGWPVDLASTGYEQFADNPVWETLMRLEPERWGFLMPEWVPFEILIILLPEDEELATPGAPGDDPGDPFDPGNDPGDPFDPGNDPGDPFDPGGDPGGGDQPRYPGGVPGGTPRIPSDEDEGVCCLPNGSCDTTTADICAQQGGAFVAGEDCGTYVCPRYGEVLCAKVDGEITDICYTYENGVLKVFASYAITNHSPIAANDITAYALVGLNDGVNGLGGGPECQDWQYGIDIPGNSTYTFDRVFSTSAPNLDLSNLTYLYGSLWLQVEAPWDCWPITKQAFVQTWDPAPLCTPANGGEPGTPPGGTDDGSQPRDPSGGETTLSGACCLPDGSCDSLTELECLRQDGLYYGPSTSCAEIRCFPPEEPPCAIIRSRVTNACQLYRGPDQPMIVKADFDLQNPGDKDAFNVGVKLVAGVPLLANLQTTYNDTHIFSIPVIPAGGSHQLTHTFSISPAPPQQPTGDTVVMIFAASLSPLCKPKITSITDLFHLLYFGPTENICPDAGGTPPGGEGDASGACCLPDGGCEALTSAECDRLGGQFQGERTSCSNVVCEGGGETDPEPQPDPEPDPDPEPTLLPNLWVTGMTGCWTWSNDGQEHVIATVAGIVHNGGQASASNVKARVTAGGHSTTVTVGTIAAGGQKTVSATIDVGAYDTTSWPVSTSITADPLHQIAEADESNNTTHSSFPQSSDCN